MERHRLVAHSLAPVWEVVEPMVVRNRHGKSSHRQRVLEEIACRLADDGGALVGLFFCCQPSRRGRLPSWVIRQMTGAVLMLPLLLFSAVAAERRWDGGLAASSVLCRRSGEVREAR